MSYDPVSPDTPKNANEATMKSNTANAAAPLTQLHSHTTPSQDNQDHAAAATLAVHQNALASLNVHPSKRTIANRMNCLKSTGPKSDQGKRKVSMNALKH